MKSEILRLSYVCKASFTSPILQGVHLNVMEGETHGVLVRNDLTRRCLVDILTGVTQPDRGRIFVEDEAVRIQAPAQAKALGIYSARQESQLLPHMSVAENLFLTNRAYYNHGFVNRRLMRTMAREYLDEANLRHIDEAAQARNLSEADRRLVEVLKQFSMYPKVLILDNIFNQYTEKEAADMLELLRRRRCALLFFSSHYNSFFPIADRVSVLRKGATAITLDRRDAPNENDARKEMLLRYQSAYRVRVSDSASGLGGDQPLLTLPERTLKNGGTFSFSLMRGEALAIVDESGRDYLPMARGVTGREPGRFTLEGESVRVANIEQAAALGIASVLPDEDAIFSNLSLTENLALTMPNPGYKAGFRRPSVQKFQAREALEALRCGDRWERLAGEKRLQNLSRNDRFIVRLAYWLCRGVKLLVLVNPYLFFDDVSAKRFPQLIRDLQKQGVSVLLFSINPELPLRACNRLLFIPE